MTRQPDPLRCTPSTYLLERASGTSFFYCSCPYLSCIGQGCVHGCILFQQLVAVTVRPSLGDLDHRGEKVLARMGCNSKDSPVGSFLSGGVAAFLNLDLTEKAADDDVAFSQFVPKPGVLQRAEDFLCFMSTVSHL